MAQWQRISFVMRRSPVRTWVSAIFLDKIFNLTNEYTNGQITSQVKDITDGVKQKIRIEQDSNLCGQRPTDFKSVPLTTPAPILLHQP